MVHRVIILGLIALSGVAHGRSYSESFLGFGQPHDSNQSFTKENMVRGIQGVTVVDVGDPKTKVLVDNDKRYVCHIIIESTPACSGPAVRYSAKKPKDYCYAIRYATMGDKFCFPSNDDTGIEFKSDNNCQSADKSPVYVISRSDFRTLCGQLPTQHKYAFYPSTRRGSSGSGGSISYMGSGGSIGSNSSGVSGGSIGYKGSGGSIGSSNSGVSGVSGVSGGSGGSSGSIGYNGSGGSNVAGGSGGSSGSKVITGAYSVPSVAGDRSVGGFSGVPNGGDMISSSMARDLGCLNFGAALSPYCEFEVQYILPSTIGATLPIMFNNEMMTVGNEVNNLYTVTNNLVDVGNVNHNIVYNISENFKGNMMG